MHLDFDGIGLDFIEGKKSLELVKTNGFPKDKILFAGVVNGKNIWRNNYAATLLIIDELKKHTSEIVLSTSCSLLHVPCTLANETKLAESYKKHFAYIDDMRRYIFPSLSVGIAQSAENENPDFTPFS